MIVKAGLKDTEGDLPLKQVARAIFDAGLASIYDALDRFLFKAIFGVTAEPALEEPTGGEAEVEPETKMGA